MAQIYVSNETKELIEKASKADSRTQDGEIQHLCKNRLAEIEAAKSKGGSK